MATQNVQDVFSSHGMATALELKCTTILPLLIILFASLAGYMETDPKSVILVPQLMNTTLESFPFIQSFPKSYCRKYPLRLKEVLKTIKTNFL
jgi:hypothetical protein